MNRNLSQHQFPRSPQYGGTVNLTEPAKEIDLTGDRPVTRRWSNEHWTTADMKGFAAANPHLMYDQAEGRTLDRLRRSKERTPGTQEHADAKMMQRMRYTRRRDLKKNAGEVADWLRSLG